MWESNKAFTSFQGNELSHFNFNIPIIVSFVTSEFGNLAEHVKNLKQILNLWSDILPFLVITKISDANLYTCQLLKFENDVKVFYQVGSMYFLTKNKMGDSENFYHHVLMYYIPHISKITFEKHHLGIGVFTMQGYERRNKESKNCFR